MMVDHFVENLPVNDSGNLLAGKLCHDRSDVGGILNHVLPDPLLNRRRDTTRDAGNDFLQLEQGKIGVPEALQKPFQVLLKRGLEERCGQAVAVEHGLEVRLGSLEDLVDLLADGGDVVVLGKLAREGLGLGDAGRVVNVEAGEDRAGLYHCPRSLVEPEATGLADRQRHHHLHHLRERGTETISPPLKK